jgi:hypothetical protein
VALRVVLHVQRLVSAAATFSMHRLQLDLAQHVQRLVSAAATFGDASLAA